MPYVNNPIQFSAGLQASYDSLDNVDENTVYFCKDSGRIFVGSVEYGITDWNIIYPINSIIMFYDSLDHSTHLGFTWRPCLIGRVPVGVDSSDPDFGTVGNTIGEKSHTLTPDESVKLTTDTHIPGLLGSEFSSVVSYGDNGQPHNNIQPSEVISFWRRIA